MAEEVVPPSKPTVHAPPPLPPKATPTPATTPVPVPYAEPVKEETLLDRINEIEPTLPGLDFKLEFDKDKVDVDLDQNK